MNRKELHNKIDELEKRINEAEDEVHRHYLRRQRNQVLEELYGKDDCT